ncbi:MAG: hypothetical protein ACRDZ5_01335, partial [Acidimicrobiales bacterium]
FRARLATRAVSAASAARETRVGGRSRKVYELTATGEELFAKLLADVVPARDGERGFSLRWAFARHLAPESRLELLERRRRHLEARLEGAKRAVSRPPRPLDRFEGSLAEHSCEVVRAERDWIDKLIATEHALLDRQSDDGALSSARSH